MNEDEHGITPADETSITVAPRDEGGYLIVIEQGNGDAIKTLELTVMERMTLANMLAYDGADPYRAWHMSFTDFDRSRTEPWPSGRTAVS